jgi:hypothetical protein
MRIRKVVTKIYEDRNIDSIIREYGIRRTAREVGIQPSNLSVYIAGKQPIPEKLYLRIIKHFMLSKLKQ